MLWSQLSQSKNKQNRGSELIEWLNEQSSQLKYRSINHGYQRRRQLIITAYNKFKSLWLHHTVKNKTKLEHDRSNKLRKRNTETINRYAAVKSYEYDKNDN